MMMDVRSPAAGYHCRSPMAADGSFGAHHGWFQLGDAAQLISWYSHICDCNLWFIVDSLPIAMRWTLNGAALCTAFTMQELSWP